MKKLYGTSVFQKIKSESFLVLSHLFVCNRIETNLEHILKKKNRLHYKPIENQTVQNFHFWQRSVIRVNI